MQRRCEETSLNETKAIKLYAVILSCTTLLKKMAVAAVLAAVFF